MLPLHPHKQDQFKSTRYCLCILRLSRRPKSTRQCCPRTNSGRRTHLRSVSVKGLTQYAYPHQSRVLHAWVCRDVYALTVRAKHVGTSSILVHLASYGYDSHPGQLCYDLLTCQCLSRSSHILPERPPYRPQLRALARDNTGTTHADEEAPWLSSGRGDCACRRCAASAGAELIILNMRAVRATAVERRPAQP